MFWTIRKIHSGSQSSLRHETMNLVLEEAIMYDMGASGINSNMKDMTTALAFQVSLQNSGRKYGKHLTQKQENKCVLKVKFPKYLLK